MSTDDLRDALGRSATRRRVTAATAWSVPVIAVASTAPAYATSIRKDPGINGWMLVTTTDQRRTSYDLRGGQRGRVVQPGQSRGTHEAGRPLLSGLPLRLQRHLHPQAGRAGVADRPHGRDG